MQVIIALGFSAMVLALMYGAFTLSDYLDERYNLNRNTGFAILVALIATVFFISLATIYMLGQLL